MQENFIYKTIRRLKDKSCETYDSNIDYVDRYGSEGGDVTASYDRINTPKVRKIQCEGMSYYLTYLEEKFYIIVDEGETLSQYFKRENLIKGIEAQ